MMALAAVQGRAENSPAGKPEEREEAGAGGGCVS